MRHPQKRETGPVWLPHAKEFPDTAPETASDDSMGRAVPANSMTPGKIQFRSQEEIRSLFGARDRNLRRLRDALQLEVVVRQDEIQLLGDASQVERGAEVVSQLRGIIERNGYLAEDDVDRILRRYRAADQSDVDASIDVFHKARKVMPLGEGQKGYIQAIRQHDLVICGGPAGSGKTYLATAMAVNALRQDLVRKIVLVRPAVEAGEKLGFLPGDMFAKVNPFLRPLLDALGDLLDYEQVQRYIDRDVIEILPLAFMRGRTLNSTFIILDEAQNTTVTQMKMFLTRMGHDSKIVVTGDTTQTDLPEHTVSGLNDAIDRLRGVQGVAIVKLSGEDIVRHPLVRRIVEAYDEEARDRAQRGAATDLGTNAIPGAAGAQGSPAHQPRQPGSRDRHASPEATDYLSFQTVPSSTLRFDSPDTSEHFGEELLDEWPSLAQAELRDFPVDFPAEQANTPPDPGVSEER